jgi:hypothetical protein
LLNFQAGDDDGDDGGPGGLEPDEGLENLEPGDDPREVSLHDLMNHFDEDGGGGCGPAVDGPVLNDIPLEEDDDEWALWDDFLSDGDVIHPPGDEPVSGSGSSSSSSSSSESGSLMSPSVLKAYVPDGLECYRNSFLPFLNCVLCYCVPGFPLPQKKHEIMSQLPNFLHLPSLLVTPKGHG